MTTAEPRPLTPSRVVALALAIGGVVVLLPFVVPLVVAAWIADLTRALVARLERRGVGRRVAAAIVTTLLAVACVGPIAIAIAVLATGAGDLIDEVRRVLAGGALDTKLAPALPAPSDWLGILRKLGASTYTVAAATMKSSARAAIDVVVLVAAAYTFAARGERVRDWLADALPIPRASFDRLASAFTETGRGLVVGIGGTALVQGIVATIAYVALGVPHGALFGFLTAISAALLPGIGTAVVWAPIAVGLAIFGEPVRAVILVVVGVAVISTIDNVLRPFLARYAKLRLPVLVVFLSMIGGLYVLGGAGVVLGPLLVRLAMEAVSITSESTVTRP